ncbi:acyltransferase [Cupriavidus basilensis]
MKKILIALRSIVLHEKIVYAVIRVCTLIVGDQINKGWGIYTLSRIKNVGGNVKFHGKSVIHDPDKIRLGNDVRVGKGCFFFCMGGLEIADGTVISRNVTIYTGNHNTSGAAVPYDNGYVKKPVKIGKAVWIGMNVSITPGVSIGNGAVIGMNTVVSRDVNPGEVVVGAAQRIVASRDMEKFESSLLDRAFFAKKWPDA